MGTTEKSSILSTSILNEPYKICEETLTTIIQLLKICQKCNLGNIEFNYFPTSQRLQWVKFQLAEYKNYWELVVSYGVQRDIYRIRINDDIILKYQYSELG